MVGNGCRIRNRTLNLLIQSQPLCQLSYPATHHYGTVPRGKCQCLETMCSARARTRVPQPLAFGFLPARITADATNSVMSGRYRSGMSFHGMWPAPSIAWNCMLFPGEELQRRDSRKVSRALAAFRHAKYNIGIKLECPTVV